MPTIDYNFNVPTEYIFDASKIDVSGGAARLEFLPGSFSFVSDLNGDAGFIYDNTKIEFTAGVAQQKDVTPQFSVLGVSFDANANPIINEADLNWHKNGGATAGILNGAPTIVGNKLVCVGLQGVYYNRMSAVVETSKFLYTPNYTSGPPQNVNIFTCTNGATNSDRFALTNSPSGNNLRITLNANDSSVVIGVATVIGGTWSPVAGQEYEFEIAINSTAGSVLLFIDGILYGTLLPGAWSRGNAILRYYLGASPEIYNVAQGSFNNLISFDSLQHSVDYTPGYNISVKIYLASVMDFPQFTHAGLGFVLSLLALTTIQSGSPLYTLSVGGAAHVYWDSLAWSVSNGSYSQANDSTTINANINALVIPSSTLTIDIKVLFDDTNIQSIIDNLELFHKADASYILSDPFIIPSNSVLSHKLNQFLPTELVAGLDSITYILRSNNINKYFDGLVWAMSDGTLAQSNDVATIQANLPTFIDQGTLVPIVLLHSDDGTSTPEIQNIFMDYDFFGALPSPENVCLVWGFLYNEINQPVVGATVTITPVKYGIIDDKLINRDAKTAVTDNQGYWQIALVETESTQNNWSYKFELPGYESVRVVPDQISVRFNDLLAPA